MMTVPLVFQSTRPVRGGTLLDQTGLELGVISIHPPRAGRDGDGDDLAAVIVAISIHPPRAGRDPR